MPERYIPLLQYLATGQWKEADEETYEVMCKVIGKNYWGAKDIEDFPCEDLRIINQLWVQFSGGRFGFSVQHDIYVEVGSKPDDQYNDATFLKFADRVKWRKGGYFLSYSDYTFDLTATPGHLPFRGGSAVSGWVFWSLLSHRALQSVTSKRSEYS